MMETSNPRASSSAILTTPVPPDLLLHALDLLTDPQLDALDGDLEVCAATGVPSTRLLRIMRILGVLDSEWSELLAKREAAAEPRADA